MERLCALINLSEERPDADKKATTLEWRISGWFKTMTRTLKCIYNKSLLGLPPEEESSSKSIDIMTIPACASSDGIGINAILIITHLFGVWVVCYMEWVPRPAGVAPLLSPLKINM